MIVSAASTDISGISIVDTRVLGDERGAFSRLFCIDALQDILRGRSVKQINFSKTLAKGAVRGLHFQLPPQAETKLVRCIRGSAWDVAIDLRKGSPTFLKYFAIELSPRNMRMVVIPEGFAHGFQALEENTELLYCHTAPYSPELESGILHDDPALGIPWPLPCAEISIRDMNHDLISTHFEGIDL